MKKILVINETIPNVHHGGGGVTAFSVVKSLIENGHKVLVVSLSSNNILHNNKTSIEIENELLELGADFISFENVIKPKETFWSLFIPKKTDVFTGYYQRHEIYSICKNFKPDAIFAYNWDSIASLTEIKSIPKLGIVGDPIHLPILFRRLFKLKFERKSSLWNKFKFFILENTRIRIMKLQMKTLLLSCNKCGAFAYHHSLDFLSYKIKGCEYYCTPVVDPLSKKSSNYQLNKKFKIIHVGHLSGIATLSGVELLANEIVPRLNELIGIDNYELHIIGAYYENMPIEIKSKLNFHNIKIRGQINPIDDEFLSSDVIIVPTPIKLGIRVRIITAFSFGSCIVAHEVNKYGIPELKNNYNSLLSNSGYQMAEDCYKLFNDKKLLTRLKMNSRLTYENHFSLNTAGKKISNTLIEMIK
jgi:glycosyltransferase involved in cell wall biosynthesis